MTRENGTILQRVAIGEFDIGIPVCVCRAGQSNGLPIQFVLPEEGVLYANWHVGKLKNAPHPNAALVYANALLEAEAQASFGNIGNAPIILGLDDKIDAMFRPFLKAKDLGAMTAQDLANAPQIAAGIYK